MKRILINILVLFATLGMKAQQLDSYIQEAEKNNPGIRAMEEKLNIAREKQNEVNSLPDTEFGLGYFVSEPETRTGPQQFKLSVKQMLPWFGTIPARENYAGSMAEVENADLEISKRKLALSVSESYYRLYALREKQQVLEENIGLLEVYHRLALNAVEVGNATSVEVLQLQMRQNDLQEQKETLENEFAAEATKFSNLLNRKEVTSVQVQDTLTIPEKEEPVAVGLHPELVKFDEFYKSIDKAEALNQKEASPRMGLGLDYINVGKRTDMQLAENGKDILMPMFSISIPIFNNKYQSVSRQNELQQKQIKANREDRLKELQTRLETAQRKRASARIRVSAQQQNLGQAKDAEEILLKRYETGTIDFDDVLDIQELQLKFQMNLIEAVTSYYRETAVINYLSSN